MNWIAANESLPDDGKNVLVYWGDPHIPMSVACHDSECRCWRDAWTLDKQSGDVTHWMQLPATPEASHE